MVLYFKSAALQDTDHVVIYMGKDKFENEDLIKYGHENDVWFHVDRHSSAHVYLRLPDDMDWENIPEALLADCGQLVKANSIEGNKVNNVAIVYTPWQNLMKTKGMDVGQVSFKKEKDVKKFKVLARDNAIVNRLNKTKEEREVDLMADSIDRQREKAEVSRAAARKRREEEDALRKERKALSEMKSYKTAFTDKQMRSNEDLKKTYENVNDFEDDFM